MAAETQAHQAWADRRTAYLEAGLSEAEAKARIKADGAELTDRVKVWDHHRKSLTLTVVGKPPLPAMQPRPGRRPLSASWPPPARMPQAPAVNANS